MQALTSDTTAQALRALSAQQVYLPGDPDFDAARHGFNLAVDQHPAAVIQPQTAADVAAAVRVAADQGLQVAVVSTGHGAATLGDLRDAVLLRTDRMRAVHVDAVNRRVRAEAGATWEDVVEAVAPHGLTVLHGSAPTVGVTGYSLGGGLGWYARSLGLAAHRITAAQLVLSDGALVHASDGDQADLMWALRGGGGSVGIVTELEFEAFPFDSAYAGRLAWDISAAERVLPVWAEWAARAPRQVTTSFRLLALPAVATLPADLRGRRLVMIDGAVLADDPESEAILAPLRALRPDVDTFGRTPTPALTRLHLDPEEPLPYLSDTVLLDSLPADATTSFLAAAGPGSGSNLLIAEIRQLGGALAEPDPQRAVLSHLPGQFAVVAFGLAPDDTAGVTAQRDLARLVAAVAPWDNGKTYLNFAERPFDTSTAFTAQAWSRLQQVRAA